METRFCQAPILAPEHKKRGMSLSSTVHGGQNDTKYVIFEYLPHATFVADTIWGCSLEAACRPCAFGVKEKKKNTAAFKTRHENDSSTATAANSRRFATKQVPRISRTSPASVHAGFVEIDHIWLSQSTTMQETRHTQQTDRPIN